MNLDSPPRFAVLLRDFRLAAGLTQEALAERARLSVHGIQKLERGVTRPFRDTVERLVAALQLPGADAETLRGAASPVRRHGTGWPAARDRNQHNLPSPLTSFVGRDRDLEELSQLVARARLLTLVGTGGCGKTRLAIELARSLVSQYPDGVWFVELAPLTDSSLVAHQIGAVVGVRDAAGGQLADTIARALEGRRTLLLLDNCEHVLEACATVIERILGGTDGVRVLATSREPIRVAGEVSWRVPSLAVPAVADLSACEHSPAVRLFVQRAAAGLPEFALTEANARAIGEVCRRLDGIPLALELAAARIGVLTPKQLATRLDQRFQLLTGGSRTALPRQQTLQATMDWSYKLLNGAERRLFEQLSVFAAHWSLGAAEQVCVGDGLAQTGILDLLANLVEKSLVVVDASEAGDDRFAYPESVREYARIKLANRGIARSRAVHQRHATFYADLVERLNPTTSGSELLHLQADVRGLEREQDNVRAALGWCVENGRVALGLRIAIRVEPYWFARGMFGEGRQWFDTLLGPSDARPPSDRSSDYGDDVLAPLQRAWALAAAAAVFGNQGNSVRALAMAEECVAILADLAPLSPNYAYALAHLGISVWVTGDVDRATALHQEGLRLGRALRAETIISGALRNLGRIALCQGRCEEAVELFNQSLASASSGWWSKNGRAERLAQLGRAHYGCGAYDKAATHFREAFAILRANEIGGYALADCLEWQAALETTIGEPLAAARLFGAAESVWRASGSQRWAPMEPGYQRDVSQLKGQLDPEQLQIAWQEGTRMTAADAVAYALASRVGGQVTLA